MFYIRKGASGDVLPDIGTILTVVLLGIITSLVPVFMSKKIGMWAEIAIAVVIVIYLFWSFSFVQASMLLAFGTSAYGIFGQLADPLKWEKRKSLVQTLRETDSVEIPLARETKRIAADWLLTLLVCLGAGLFFAFAPENYSVLKFFAGLMLLSVSANMAGRTGNFYSTRLFWLPDKERLIILSLF